MKYKYVTTLGVIIIIVISTLLGTIISPPNETINITITNNNPISYNIVEDYDCYINKTIIDCEIELIEWMDNTSTYVIKQTGDLNE